MSRHSEALHESKEAFVNIINTSTDVSNTLEPPRDRHQFGWSELPSHAFGSSLNGGSGEGFSGRLTRTS